MEHCRWDMMCWFHSVSPAFGNFPLFLSIAQQGQFPSGLSDWWDWRLSCSVSSSGGGSSEPEQLRMGKVNLKLHVLCAGSVKSPLNACLVLQTACMERAGLDNGLLGSVREGPSSRPRSEARGGWGAAGGKLRLLLSSRRLCSQSSLSCFLNLSCLCSLLDDISGTLPTSVLVGPMGSSLQSFPLPPPPPPHAPGQLSFSSKALPFPFRDLVFGLFFLYKL